MKKFIEPEIRISRFTRQILLGDSDGDPQSSHGDVASQLRNSQLNSDDTILTAAWNGMDTEG